MNLYILINSAAYVVVWNVAFIVGSEVKSLVLAASLLLFSPLFLLSELGRGKEDKWIYRSFKKTKYDAILLWVASITGALGGLSSIVCKHFQGGLFFIFWLIGLTVINALVLGLMQLVFFQRLKAADARSEPDP